MQKDFSITNKKLNITVIISKLMLKSKTGFKDTNKYYYSKYFFYLQYSNIIKRLTNGQPFYDMNI